jgi:predicted RNA-binding protein with TRAM domain
MLPDGISKMLNTVSTSRRADAENDCIRACTIVSANHEAALHTAMEALDDAIALYRPRPILCVEGLRETQVTIMHLARPHAGFRNHRPGFSVIINEAEFDAVEEAISRLCPNATSARLVFVDFEILDEDVMAKLEAIIAKWPHVFGHGIQRV